MLKSTVVIRSITLLASLLLCFTSTNAQTRVQSNPQPPTDTVQKPGPSVTQISTNYYEPKRDPFRGEFKIKEAEKEIKPTVIDVVPYPSYEEREAEWRTKRSAANKQGQPSPAVSEKYLIDEIQVVGIFKKPEGNGVFIKPKNTSGTTIFAMIGEKFYNGKLIKIDGNDVEFEEQTLLSTKKTRNEKRVIRFTRK